MTLESCAKRVIELTRQGLDTELPELQPAIFLLPLQARNEFAQIYGSPISLWTDGNTLFYNPQLVVQTYREDRKAVARLMLHILLHGLLGHFESCTNKESHCFGTAADIQVTDLLLRYARSYLKLSGPPSTKYLLTSLHGHTAEQICEYFEDTTGKSRLHEAAKPLIVDVHTWESCNLRRDFAEHWADAARLVAMNLRDAMRDDLADELCEESEELG